MCDGEKVHKYMRAQENWYLPQSISIKVYMRPHIHKDMINVVPTPDFIPSLPGCVCPKVMDMGPFLASSE